MMLVRSLPVGNPFQMSGQLDCIFRSNQGPQQPHSHQDATAANNKKGVLLSIGSLLGVPMVDPDTCSYCLSESQEEDQSLHHAALHGNAECMQLLFEKGADVNAVDSVRPDE